MKVQVYWNVRRKAWSVRHEGRVIAHETIMKLEDCRFVVQPAGRERVRKEKRKNVHAYISGEWTPPGDEGVEVDLRGTPVTYNPYNDETFVQEGKPIHEAPHVHLTTGGSWQTEGFKKRPLVFIPS